MPILRNKWGVVAGQIPFYGPNAPFAPQKNEYMAISVLAGPEGATARHIRVDQMRFDGTANFMFGLWVFRGPMPATVIEFGRTSGLFPNTISPPVQAGALRGVDVLYHRILTNCNTIAWPLPSMQAVFADGSGPSVGPGEYLTVALIPYFYTAAPNGGAANYWSTSLCVLGGINRNYSRAANTGAQQYRAAQKGTF